MTADQSSRPSALRRVDSKMEKSRPAPEADTVPLASWNLWRDAPRIAVIGIFILLLGAFLYAARTLIAPIVAAGKAHDIDAESALAGWARRFRDRFQRMEALARERGIDLSVADPAVTSELWNAV